MSHFRVPVSQYMTSPVITVPTGASLAEADQRLHENDVSALGVVDRTGKLVGVISRTDLLAAGTYGHDHVLTLPDGEVSELMSSPPLLVEATSTVAEAGAMMMEHHAHRVFVAPGGRPAGVISTRDLMQAVVDQDLSRPIGELQQSPVVSLDASDPVTMAVERLDSSNKHGIVVLDQTWPVGVFDQRAALAARGLKPEVPVSEAMSLKVLVLPAQLSIARAAAQCIAMRARRIIVTSDHRVTGIVSGLDFARLVATSR